MMKLCIQVNIPTPTSSLTLTYRNRNPSTNINRFRYPTNDLQQLYKLMMDTLCRVVSASMCYAFKYQHRIKLIIIFISYNVSVFTQYSYQTLFGFLLERNSVLGNFAGYICNSVRVSVRVRVGVRVGVRVSVSVGVRLRKKLTWG